MNWSPVVSLKDSSQFVGTVGSTAEVTGLPDKLYKFGQDNKYGSPKKQNNLIRPRRK